MTAPAKVAPAKAPSSRDAALHAEVCQRPRRGSWSSRCACLHVQVRHLDLTHTSIPTGAGVTCSGRNNAGRCGDCDCPRFTLTTAAEAA